MKRLLHKLSIMMCLASLGTAQVVVAQTAVLDGYYRIQNVRDGNYVQIRGAFTAAPDQTLGEAYTEPGSVFYVKAVQENNYRDEPAFRIVSLRSQGVDVIGQGGYSYLDLQNDLMSAPDVDLDMTILHSITKLGFDRGYVNVGRAALEFFIYFMGAYLNDNYKGSLGAEAAAVDLEALTKNFIETVAENINLNLYLEPVKTAVGAMSYRLYYDIPDLQPVCDWYLNPENKEKFEVGFAAMRVGLQERGVSSGEYLDDAEVAEMAANGYTLPDKYRTDIVAVGSQDMFHVPYEKIFADKDLLFAWLKMNVIRLLDPDRCPKISLKGIYLPSIGKELRNHRLTAQLISYLPRFNPGRRICLISGLLSNGGVEGTSGTDYSSNGQFGFVSAETTGYVLDADKWNVIPIDDDNNYFAIGTTGDYYAFDSKDEGIEDVDEADKRGSEGGYYVPMYLDFPVEQPADGSVRFYTLTNQAAAYDTDGVHMTGSKVAYPALTRTIDKTTTTYYYELERMTDQIIPAHTPFFAVCSAADGNKVRIPYETLAPSFDLAGSGLPNSLPVSDDDAVIGQQSLMLRAEAADGLSSVFRGTLLPVAADLLTKYGYDDYDSGERPVYSLSVSSGRNNRKMTANKSGVRSNEAFLLAPLGWNLPEGDNANIYIGVPQDTSLTGIEDIMADGAEGEPVVYDIYGRRVTEMISGQIYIVNGCKTVAF